LTSTTTATANIKVKAKKHRFCRILRKDAGLDNDANDVDDDSNDELSLCPGIVRKLILFPKLPMRGRYCSLVVLAV
jgi:hypothetical protein